MAGAPQRTTIGAALLDRGAL